MDLYTVRRENLNILTNKLLSRDVQVFSMHPVFCTYLVKKSSTVQHILVMTVLLFIHFLTSFLSVNVRLKKFIVSTQNTVERPKKYQNPDFQISLKKTEFSHAG